MTKQHWAHFYSDKECTEANETDCIAYDGTFKQDPQWLIDQYVSKGEDDWQAIRFIHANKKTTYTIYRPSTLYIFHSEPHPTLKSAFKGCKLKKYDLNKLDTYDTLDYYASRQRLASLCLFIKDNEYLTIVINPSPAAILMAKLIIDSTDDIVEVNDNNVALLESYEKEVTVVANIFLTYHSQPYPFCDALMHYPEFIKATETFKQAKEAYFTYIKSLKTEIWDKFEKEFKR